MHPEDTTPAATCQPWCVLDPHPDGGHADGEHDCAGPLVTIAGVHIHRSGDRIVVTLDAPVVTLDDPQRMELAAALTGA